MELARRALAIRAKRDLRQMNKRMTRSYLTNVLQSRGDHVHVGF
jgi:hypothetical protein